MSHDEEMDAAMSRIGVLRLWLDDVKAENARLKAENERLNTGIQPEGNNDAVGRAVNVLLEKEKEIARLKAEVERLKAVSTIEQRTIQGLQQTPEWSEIARLTAYCRELEAKLNREGKQS